MQQSNLSACKAAVQLSVKQDNSMSVVIERKLANEVIYTPFKTFAGSGNFSNKNLSFTDDLSVISAGSVNYRIRLDIAADTSFYLDSLVINSPQTCQLKKENNIKINPNPVVDIANIVISRITSTKINIVLLNLAGKRIYQTTYQQAAGSTATQINMKQIAGGIYFLSIFADDKKIITEKILKR